MYGLVGTLAQSTILLVGILGKFSRKEERCFLSQWKSDPQIVLHSIIYSPWSISNEKINFSLRIATLAITAVCQSVSQQLSTLCDITLLGFACESNSYQVSILNQTISLTPVSSSSDPEDIRTVWLFFLIWSIICLPWAIWQWAFDYKLFCQEIWNWS